MGWRPNQSALQRWLGRVVLQVRKSLLTTVIRLGLAIHQEHLFDHLPILTDALEDAGCTNADILAHCRGPRPHVRGCWVVDLLLDKA
jgi:hypothetical protein